jgi:hypothetical protein
LRLLRFLRQRHAIDSKTAALLSEIIRVNTSNPPGNEKALDELLAGPRGKV